MPLVTSTLGLIAPEYGYVMLSAIATSFVGAWHSVQAGGARRRAKIPYPQTFATPEQEKASSEALKFNCAQRAHANFNETLPIFMTLFVVAATRYPTYAAIANAVWLVGRVMYTRGYMTGDPAKRMQGGLQYIGLFSMLVMSFIASYKTLGF